MITRSALEGLYKRYNRRKLVHPDPLEFLYHYPDVRDREIVGLIASSLAYGRVAQILKSVSNVLERMHPTPFEYLKKTQNNIIRSNFSGFRHRFTTGTDKADLLIGIKHVIKKHGSLKNCFVAGFKNSDANIVPALSKFVAEVNKCAGVKKLALLPPPELGSACKRLNLFLRWMVRKDAVDPGGWRGLPTSKLVIPLDTHMYKISMTFGFTKRRQANLKTALEITKRFAQFSAKDPTRYDFALTRFGIRDDMKMGDLTNWIKRYI